MKLTVLFTCLLFLLTGCSYYSETCIKASADKLKGIIPAGAMPIPAEGKDMDAWIIRKMECKLWVK